MTAPTNEDTARTLVMLAGTIAAHINAGNATAFTLEKEEGSPHITHSIEFTNEEIASLFSSKGISPPPESAVYPVRVNQLVMGLEEITMELGLSAGEIVSRLTKLLTLFHR